MTDLSLHFSSAREDWITPRPIFETRHAEHCFDVDLAAHSLNHRLPRYFGQGGEHSNALVVPWAQLRGWLNPPYGRGLGRWLAKAARDAKRGGLVDMLNPARTDTRWWHRWVMRKARRVQLVEGRIVFDLAPVQRTADLCKHYTSAQPAERARARGCFGCGAGSRAQTCPHWQANAAPFPSAFVTFDGFGGPPSFEPLRLPDLAGQGGVPPFVEADRLEDSPSKG